MVTNVSEKDKALQEVIDWCEQREIEGLRLANALLMQRDMDAYGVVKGQINAYEKTADQCRSMLGYSVSMPSEVPNQSEDAKKMKWKPDWMDIAENLLIGLVVVSAAAIFIVFCVCVWKDVTTERTIIMRDGNQSYACSISDISPNPYDCKPIEDTEE